MSCVPSARRAATRILHAAACVALALCAPTLRAQQAPGVMETVAGGGVIDSVGMIGAIAPIAGRDDFYFLSNTLNRIFHFDPSTGAIPVAGTGFIGFTGDGGNALSATFDFASDTPAGGLAFHTSTGNLFISDVRNRRLRAIRSDGTVHTYAGSGACTRTTTTSLVPLSTLGLCRPEALATAANGPLYLVDEDRLWQIAPFGATAMAGPGLPVTLNPGVGAQLALDDVRRRLYVSRGRKVQVFDLATGAATTYLDFPSPDPENGAIAVNPVTGDLFVAGQAQNFAGLPFTFVRRYPLGTTSGVVVAGGGSNFAPFAAGTLAGSTSLGGYAALAITGQSRELVVAPAGWLHLTSSQLSRISTVGGNGDLSYCGDGRLATAACLNAVEAVTVDATGAMTIADGNNVLRRVDASGTITTVRDTAGQDTAIFGRGLRLQSAPNGHYVASAEKHAVFFVDALTGNISWIAGLGCATSDTDPDCELGDGGPPSFATFNEPAGMALDAGGALFVADTLNNRVRRIDLNGPITTVAGNGTVDQPGDNVPATAISVYNPVALAFDPDGSLLILERGPKSGLPNGRIRRVSAGADGIVTGRPDEIITTLAGVGTGGQTDDGVGALDADLGKVSDFLRTDESIFIADAAWPRILVLDRQTNAVTRLAGGGTHPGDGVFPRDVQFAKRAAGGVQASIAALAMATVNGQPFLYLADQANLRIRRFPLPLTQNLPPVVDAGTYSPVIATSPQGVELYLMGTVDDPDDASVTATWTGPFAPVSFDVSAQFPGNAAALVRLPIGTSSVTLTVDDHHGNVVNRTASIQVLATNTAAGTNVTVEPVDDTFRRVFGFTPGRVQLRFTTVNDPPGLTYLRTRTDQVPVRPPAGLQLGSTPHYYDVGIPGSVAGATRVCVDIRGMSFIESGTPKLYQLSGGAWSELPPDTPPSSDGVWICGSRPAWQGLMTFAVFTQADERTRVQTIAGNGGPFVPGRPAPGDGGPAASAPLTFPTNAAIDRARGYMYVNDMFRIRRIDLVTGVIDTIAGTGSFESINHPHYGLDAREAAVIANYVAVDTAGNIFVSDINGCGISRIGQADNIITRVAGRGWDPTTLECGPHDGDGGPAHDAHMNLGGQFLFDASGNLYFSQILLGTNGFTIRRIAAGADGLITGADDEIVTTVAGGGAQWPPPDGDPRAALLNPNGMAFASRGDMYIASGGFVLRLTPAPGSTGIVGAPGEVLTRVAGAPVLDYAQPFQGDGGPALAANFGNAWGVAVLPGGDLVIGDQGFNRLRRITTGGDGSVDGQGDERISTIAGFSRPVLEDGSGFNGDGYALSTSFWEPRQLVLDPAGGLVVVDTGQGRIRRIDFPFAAANRAPVADAGEDRTISAAGPTLVHLDGSGSSDPDGDDLSYAWSDDTGPIGTGAILDVLQNDGVTKIYTLTVTDGRGGSATDSVTVTVEIDLPPVPVRVDESIHVIDTHVAPVLSIPLVIDESVHVIDTHVAPTLSIPLVVDESIHVIDRVAVTSDASPPVVTPPPALTVAATEAGGARGNVPGAVASAAIASFLAAGRAVDNSDPSPLRLSPRAVIGPAETDVDHTTLFPVGDTVVIFRFRDGDGNVGTAQSTLTVLPAIGGVATVAGAAVPATTDTGALTPVTVQFSTIHQPGLVTATPMLLPAPLPDGYAAVSPVFDIQTTAIFTGSLIVCIDGNYEASNVLFHFSLGGWSNVTVPTNVGGRLCGTVVSLSPFVAGRPANRPPSVDAGTYPPVEAVSPAGATVLLNGSGNDPDAGDQLSFVWREGATVLAQTAAAQVPLGLGTHVLTLTATDTSGATAVSPATVIVRDTTSPAVRPPASILVPASEAAGTRPSAWPALAAFVSMGAASAADAVDPAPLAQAPRIGAIAVTPSTLFPVGTTQVTFSFVDKSGNLGVATANVTVQIGTPRISARIVSQGSLTGTKRYVDIEIANTGDGHARQVSVDLILVLPAQVSYMSPALPVRTGSLDVGARVVQRIVVNVPRSVTSLSITEAGTLRTINGTLKGFLETQKVEW